VLKGVGTSSDGKGNAVYAPVAKGQAEALRAAYRDAGVSAATVELVEGHGTGTKVGDAIEAAALSEVFRESRADGAWCALGSVKSQIGHTKAAAGAAGLVKAALALHRQVLPPTIKVDRPLDSLATETTPLYLNADARPWLPSPDHPRRAAVSSFGFGGSNFHCVLEEHVATEPGIDWDCDLVVGAVAADTSGALLEELDRSPADLFSPAGRRWAALRRTEFRPDAPWRATFVAERGRQDAAAVRQALRGLVRGIGDRPFAESPDGVFVGQGRPAGKLAAIFPGQGAQYVGMQRDVSCRFPAMRRVLAEADAVFADRRPEENRRLSEFVYPHSAFDEAARERQADELLRTDIAQPALGAVSLGLLDVLSEWEVRPEVVAGHSYGELVALCAARCYDERTLHWLSLLRGRLMASHTAGEGGMLAVHAASEEVESLLREERIALSVANRNAPRQVVLSGLVAELERAAIALDSRRVRNQRLRVAAAFHGPAVASASRPFAAALREATFRAPAFTVFANSTACEYPATPDEARELLAGQIMRPVEFVAQVENMHASGVRTFLEVGPGARLTGLVRSILDGKPFEAARVGRFGRPPFRHDRSGAVPRQVGRVGPSLQARQMGS